MLRGAATIAGAALIGALAACATPGSPSVTFDTAAWFEPVDPVRIVGPIWYVGTKDLGAYLITTPSGHILIDGAMPGSGPTIEASIRKAGFKPEEIRLLLITHAHVDHVGTLAYFKKLSGAPVAAMAPDDDLLESGGRKDYLYAARKEFRFPRVTADRVLKDGETVTVGDVTLTALHTPGHTRGSTTWTMTADGVGGSYFVVFPASTSINPGTRLVKDPSYPGIVEDYRQSLAALVTLHPDIFLPAHASAFDLEGKRARAATEGEKAFVDPQGYLQRMRGQRATLEQAIAGEGGVPAAAWPGGSTTGRQAAAGGMTVASGMAAGLSGTAWRLVRFQGGDDTVLTPDDSAKYTLAFGADGTVSVRLDCNRGHGTWKSAGPGQLELGPLALTRAMCPPGSMDTQIVKHWEYVRSYVQKDGRLHLSLMADGGIYEFEPN